MAQSFEAIGRVSNASVLKCTRRGWREWINLLDRAGARSMSHSEIVALLRKKYRLSLWWQQGVTHGYEIAIGRRIEGQDIKGRYMMTATKSLHVAAKEVWRFMTTEPGFSAWLQPLSPVKLRLGDFFETKDGYFGEFRTMKVNRRLRFTWKEADSDNASLVQITLVARAKGRSILVFSHEGIRTAALKAQFRKRWEAAIGRLLWTIGPREQFR